MCELPRGKITPEQLHEWYLESLSGLDPDSYNPKAKIPYEELAEEQKSIDKFIVGKINERQGTKVKFYKKYVWYPEKFQVEQPEIFKESPFDFVGYINSTETILFNSWLFNYCFGDVLLPNEIKEITDENVSNTVKTGL